LVCVCVVFATVAGAQAPANLVLRVQSEAGPVTDALVTVGNQTVEADDRGRASVRVWPGAVTVTVKKPGFLDLLNEMAGCACRRRRRR